MEKQLKILQLTDAYYPSVDGVISVVKNYTENLNEICECHIAAPKPSKKSKFKEITAYKILRCKSTPAPEGYRNAVPYLDKKFLKTIQDADYDLLHAHTPFGMGRCAVKLAKRKNIPLVATLHTQYHRDFERTLGKHSPLVKFMLKYILKTYNNADSVWTVSNASKKYLRDYGYTGEIKVIRNATDFVYPEIAPELIKTVNEKYGLEGQENLFLFVGRMALYKNINLILEAVRILKDEGADFKMVFVGDGFDLKEIKSNAKKLNILDKCLFTGGIKDRQLLQGFYLRSDLFIFPSTFDMASICKCEAAAHKLASLVVKDSCSAEEVVDGENGFLCEESAESLASVMLKLIKEPSLMKTAGENAYKTLYRTWKDVAKEVKQAYEEIIKEYKENN